MSKVPSKDYARQYGALLPELLPALRDALLNEAPILGAPVAAFERSFAAYVGTREAVGVASGTDALILALRALGIGPGDEVVTAANTFVATVTAILAVGARPVLVDPDPETLNLDAAGASRALSPRTRAVIPVHLYGRAAPADELRRALPAGVRLLEDAAQAHGARTADGRRAGAAGDAGCFSFHPSKNLGAFGDAGLVTTDDPALAEELRLLRNLGKRDDSVVARVGYNSKLDTLQAVVLGLKLPRLDTWNARRREHAQRYAHGLAGVGDLRLPAPAMHPEGHAFHLYVVRTARRDALRAHLAARGVRASIHYAIPPHLQDLGVDLGYPAGSLPVAEEAARTVLSLPIAPELEEAEIDQVIDGVRSFLGSRVSAGGRA